MTTSRRVALVVAVVAAVAGTTGCAEGRALGPDLVVAEPSVSARQTPPPPVVPPSPTASAPADATVQAVPEPASSPDAAAEDAVLALANQARADAGLPPLESSADLDAVARGWSVTMADAGMDLQHNPDYAAQIPSGWSSTGENVGWMGPSDLSAADVAARIHASWMESPGHRANLLNPAFTHIGVGVATGPAGWYLTQDFAAY